MIKIENVEVSGWDAAIRGMRNPMNSWDKSDSYWTHIEDPETLNTAKFQFFLGENDLKLMKALAKSGSDHRKFMRMLTLSCDITAPIYWTAQQDTYKISTVRNSCSFMHKGLSKPFEIRDFSVADERIYDVLSPLEKKKSELKYPYDTDEYKIYITSTGRKYKVFKNGRVFRCKYSHTDNWGNGRTRVFGEKEVTPSRTVGGYYELNIGGRAGEKWLLHRLVAKLWCENPDRLETVNHIDGDKGNNSAENLEWISREDNIGDGFENGLFKNISSLHSRYLKWKNGAKDAIPKDKRGNENYELFCMCYHWEKIIDALNSLRQEYIDTKDEGIFHLIRQLLPQGYNVRYTWQCNYEVLSNIYRQRKHHRLCEWIEFCDWIKTLPYAELITGESEDEE